VRLLCSGCKCHHDALVMWLLLRQDATDEGAGVLVRGGGSLDLKCYCFNALTDEGMRAMSSLTALWKCSGGPRWRTRGCAACPRSRPRGATHRFEQRCMAERLAGTSPSTAALYMPKLL
jgi:hypothetical protein